MTFDLTITFLRNRIESSLAPLVDADYVLWDCPYYSNIGDILIWEGTARFLHANGRRCLDMASKETCRFPELSPDTVIVLLGGGNFGDLWREHQDFRLKVIAAYPRNRIIVLPQSVYYRNEECMCQDARQMSLHHDLILCARDDVSFETLKSNFTNEVLLLPDMAFCIPYRKLAGHRRPENDRTLFIKRADSELVVAPYAEESLPNTDVHDWPTMESQHFVQYLLNKLLAVCRHTENHKTLQGLSCRIADFYAYRIYRPICVRCGVKLVSGYKNILTTRLHVMILSILLHKAVGFFDNSYGKNMAFYRTWLRDLEEVANIPMS